MQKHGEEFLCRQSSALTLTHSIIGLMLDCEIVTACALKTSY